MKSETIHGKKVLLEVNIANLKVWAMRNLSLSSNLRAILHLEPDLLTVDQFLAKMSTWLITVELESRDEKRGTHD
jgi:hypothetical protein